LNNGAKKKAGRPKKTTHSSGLYRKRITLGHDPKTGKRILKAVYGKSPEEVKDKIARLRVDRGMGIVITNNKSSFEYWATSWESITEPTVSIGTWMNYKTALKHLSVFNKEKISQINSVEFESFLLAKFNDGYSRRILNLLLNTASRIFRLARRNHAIMLDPTEDVKVPQGAKVEKREAISQEAQKKIWELKPLTAHNKSEKVRNKKMEFMRMFALMQLTCGLRREEVVPLDWKDIDFKTKSITINKAYDFKAKCLKTPKSKSGYRTIPIPDNYFEELVKLKSKSDPKEKLVFPYNHAIITGSEFCGLWFILLDGINGISLSDRITAGIKDANNRKKSKDDVAPEKWHRRKMDYKIKFTSHQLRHTYATNCIASGIDVRTVQYLMGHATANITMEYTHPSESAILEAREKINTSNNLE
jgi:integrase